MTDQQRKIDAYIERQRAEGNPRYQQKSGQVSREHEQEQRAAAEALPWPRLRPAERIAKLMNLGDTGGVRDVWHWRTIAEIIGSQTIETRNEWNGLLMTAYHALTRAVRTRAGEPRSVWTVRTGPRSTVTVWLDRKTQTIYAKRTGPRPPRSERSPYQVLAELFLATSGKLLRCVECGRWFPRRDQRQRSCATACADRARKRRQRGGGRRTPVQRARQGYTSAVDFGLEHHGDSGSDWIGGSTNWNARHAAYLAEMSEENGEPHGFRCSVASGNARPIPSPPAPTGGFLGPLTRANARSQGGDHEDAREARGTGCSSVIRAPELGLVSRWFNSYLRPATAARRMDVVQVRFIALNARVAFRHVSQASAGSALLVRRSTRRAMSTS
jgi:hypothetical protein